MTEPCKLCGHTATRSVEPTQHGDEIAAEMRSYYEANKRQRFVEGNADNLMLGLLNIARSGDGELRCNQCGKKGGGHHPSCILGPALSSIRDR